MFVGIPRQAEGIFFENSNSESTNKSFPPNQSLAIQSNPIHDRFRRKEGKKEYLDKEKKKRHWKGLREGRSYHSNTPPRTHPDISTF